MPSPALTPPEAVARSSPRLSSAAASRRLVRASREPELSPCPGRGLVTCPARRPRPRRSASASVSSLTSATSVGTLSAPSVSARASRTNDKARSSESVTTTRDAYAMSRCSSSSAGAPPLAAALRRERRRRRRAAEVRSPSTAAGLRIERKKLSASTLSGCAPLRPPGLPPVAPPVRSLRRCGGVDALRRGSKPVRNVAGLRFESSDEDEGGSRTTHWRYATNDSSGLAVLAGDEGKGKPPKGAGGWAMPLHRSAYLMYDTARRIGSLVGLRRVSSTGGGYDGWGKGSEYDDGVGGAVEGAEVSESVDVFEAVRVGECGEVGEDDRLVRPSEVGVSGELDAARARPDATTGGAQTCGCSAVAVRVDDVEREVRDGAIVVHDDATCSTKPSRLSPTIVASSFGPSERAKLCSSRKSSRRWASGAGTNAVVLNSFFSRGGAGACCCCDCDDGDGDGDDDGRAALAVGPLGLALGERPAEAVERAHALDAVEVEEPGEDLADGGVGYREEGVDDLVGEALQARVPDAERVLARRDAPQDRQADAPGVDLGPPVAHRAELVAQAAPQLGRVCVARPKSRSLRCRVAGDVDESTRTRMFSGCKRGHEAVSAAREPALDDTRELIEDAPGLVGREDAVGRRGDEVLERDRRAQALLDEVQVARRADRLEHLDEVAVW
ncbi:uncharacterized protein RHOBADRAFT_22423 [Rhodotorula graminis WP1]|uniref:Uncharacterized protein n=1 Tax=Rhodotorula graminis (strain WP1) TaxID=578459 RepID=A0A0P9H0N9_RHOGW|nr:uncharacterized protein RHOBADRAFT_22423 [Rhodotorula graminis WP1]KPV73416.1 hypothetical protein RHOBADRAFT_22423 [Rhodotorula graminis WP1]